MKRFLMLMLLMGSPILHAQSWNGNGALAGQAPPVTGALTFAPVAGSYTGSTTVSISTTLSGGSVFCTTDGTPANAAANFIGTAPAGGGLAGTIVVTSTQTLNCTAAQNAVTHQNVNRSQSGSKVVIATCTVNGADVCHRGTPTATSGGGVGSNVPTTWDYVWGSTYTQSMTAPAYVQILAPFSGTTNDGTVGQTLMLVQRKIVQATVDKTHLQNNEADSQAIDATHKINGMSIEHNYGLQCEQASDTSSPGHWCVGGGWNTQKDHWACTPVTSQCPWGANVTIEFATQGHYTVGDVACGGYGCFTYDWLEVNGVRYPLSTVQLCPTSNSLCAGIGVGQLSNEVNTWASFMGSQDQLDNYNTTATIGRKVTYANVTVALYSATPVSGSASYTIH
jgi:hypothetical protein